MTEPAFQPAKHGRSLVGFYIALGVVAVLVGLGAWLYRPLMLAYAIHRVEQTAEYLPIRPGMGIPVADRWLVYCMEAARAGNRRAMAVVIEHAGVKTPPSYQGNVTAPLEGPDVAFLAAADQPRLFFEMLDRFDDQQVLTVLKALLDVPDASGEALFGSKQAARELEAHLESQDGAVRAMAQVALDFVRRRFGADVRDDAEALERRIVAAPYGGRSGNVSGSISLMTERIVLAGRLAEAGAAAYPNLRRLLTSPDQKLRAEVLGAFHHPKYTWLLPLIMESARDGDADTVREAYAAARNTVGGSPNPMQPVPPLDPNASDQQQVQALRNALLAWWEREGQAKYGGGEK